MEGYATYSFLEGHDSLKSDRSESWGGTCITYGRLHGCFSRQPSGLGCSSQEGRIALRWSQYLPGTTEGS